MNESKSHFFPSLIHYLMHCMPFVFFNPKTSSYFFVLLPRLQSSSVFIPVPKARGSHSKKMLQSLFSHSNLFTFPVERDVERNETSLSLFSFCSTVSFHHTCPLLYFDLTLRTTHSLSCCFDFSIKSRGNRANQILG